MEQKLSEILAKNPFQKLTKKEVLESYNHIELTEDEITDAMIYAKIKKEEEQKSLAQKLREEENRKMYTQQTSYDLIKSLMAYRADKRFEGKFIIDDNNRVIFELLCHYFGSDQQFESIAASMGIDNPSLGKGILLAGNFGVGKTWIMKLFQQNMRQCYYIKSAKDIADDFQSDGEECIEEYYRLKENPLNDSSVFYQKHSGLCVDDLGTEDIKNYFGNKKNVIGDLIEKRYFRKNIGLCFHGTTNLTSAQLNEFYGGRVVSRMREIFNFIELKGRDRRK